MSRRHFLLIWAFVSIFSSMLPDQRSLLRQRIHPQSKPPLTAVNRLPDFLASENSYACLHHPPCLICLVPFTLISRLQFELSTSCRQLTKGQVYSWLLLSFRCYSSILLLPIQSTSRRFSRISSFRSRMEWGNAPSFENFARLFNLLQWSRRRRCSCRLNWSINSWLPFDMVYLNPTGQHNLQSPL